MRFFYPHRKDNKMLKVGLYARVSTHDGRQDTDMQLTELREYCTARCHRIVREYVERLSGIQEDRPQLAALMRDARARRIDAVMVWRFDRFARSTRSLVMALEEFRHLGIEFISLREQIDTASPMGKAMFTMIAAMAEFEHNLIKERVRAGLRNARARGVKLGRPRKGFDVHRAIELKRAGQSWTQLAGTMQVSSATLRRVLYPLLKNHPANPQPILAQ